MSKQTITNAAFTIIATNWGNENMQPLVERKIYSPLYNTTFDKMTYEQQVHQLEVWGVTFIKEETK